MILYLNCLDRVVICIACAYDLHAFSWWKRRRILLRPLHLIILIVCFADRQDDVRVFVRSVMLVLSSCCWLITLLQQSQIYFVVITWKLFFHAVQKVRLKQAFHWFGFYRDSQNSISSSWNSNGVILWHCAG